MRTSYLSSARPHPKDDHSNDDDLFRQPRLDLYQKQDEEDVPEASSDEDNCRGGRAPESEKDIACSVLITTIDHIMCDPSPMEPEEFQSIPNPSSEGLGSAATAPGVAATTEPPPKVPVMRIFGPIVRRDSPGRRQSILEPHQSACLYVHQAYPYLLARPVIAGPDGSIHRSAHLLKTKQKSSGGSISSDDNPVSTDWDNYDEVNRIVPLLQKTLETTIQTKLQSWMDTDKDTKSKDNATTSTATKPDATMTSAPPLKKKKLTVVVPKIIRSIRVVMGRGFYTYCPGPPAPFLRIEYYDPSRRWVVKSSLERGLDIPLQLYPNPLQYDPNPTHREASTADPGLLQFHCYEAHVPYSMQFFKDHNLRGCSYMHLSNVRFRAPLPNRIKKRSPHQVEPVESSSQAFLQSNTPSNLLWWSETRPATDILAPPAPHEGTTGMDLDDHDDNASTGSDTQSLAHIAALHQPSQSQSSSASGATWSQQNSSPIPPDFAVADPVLPPALMKLSLTGGNEGRKLMGGPWSKTMTSCDVELDVSVDHILNVQEILQDYASDAEVDRLNVHWRAVPSLREIWMEERMRMSKLVPPHEDFLSHPDASTNPPAFTLSVKKDAPMSGTRLAREGMERLVQVSPGLQENFRRVMRDIVERHRHIIRHVDAALMLQEGKDIEADEEVAESATGRSSSSDQPVQPDRFISDEEALLALDQLADLSPRDGLGQLQESRKSLELSTSASDYGSNHYDILSQEHFESIQLSSTQRRFQSCSQVYYSSQLSQSQRDQDELDDYEYSQRVDRGESIVDGEFHSVHEFLDPRTLTPHELVNDEGSEDAMDEHALENLLHAYATQTLLGEPGASSAQDNDSPTQSDPPTGFADSVTSPHDDRMVANIDKIEIRNLKDAQQHADACTLPWYSQSSQFSGEHDHNGTLDGSNHVEPAKLDLDESAETISSTIPWNSLKQDECVHIGLARMPPSRCETTGRSATSLLPMELNYSQPSWMKYSVAYERIRILPKDSSHWLLMTNSPVALASLVRSAPTQKEVLSWSRRQAKHGSITQEKERFRSKEGKPKATSREPVARVDENSRRLIFESSDERQEIEEVEWQGSQHVASQTQELEQEDRGKSSMITEQHYDSQVVEFVSSQSLSRSQSSTSCIGSPNMPLQGMGNQGGRLHVEKGGALKAKTRPSQGMALNAVEEGKEGHRCAAPYLKAPISLMIIETHVQCRHGPAGPNDSRLIAMTPDSNRDEVYAVVYLYGNDPGGGDELQVLDRGCIFIPVKRELQDARSSASVSLSLKKLAANVCSSLPNDIMGYVSPLSIECVEDERQLIFRLASIVRNKDPDILLSWDTQGSGLGYLIERGVALGKSVSSASENDVRKKIGVAKLLGRTPTISCESQGNFGHFGTNEGDTSLDHVENDRADKQWKGSGLGAEWDDRVGAGAAAASIVGRLVFAAWKLVAEEVKHPNASYLQAVTSSVLGERIPFHDNKKLTEWYGHNEGKERWRVLHHKFVEAGACLRLFNTLDIIGRAGEAARLSGVEFFHSFPDIRGSQYKVEGVLLRALQSLNSDNRGSKRGREKASNLSGGGFSSLSSESKSQTQSPWKVRRRLMQSKRGSVKEDSSQPVNRGYFFYSPSKHDADRQEALQVQALTLEPLSGHFQDPVVVCDFTALYPSLVIAYNLCYSTVCGHLEYHSTREEMRRRGRTTGAIGPLLYPEGRTATVLKHHMKSLEECDGRSDRVYVVPSGTMFVAESILKGVLPQVLDEMLSTRAMLKKAAKQYKRLVPDISPAILRQLEARQLALKYVANVTYGYTSATFSGRCAMPRLADSIVEAGRRTLTNAISLANEWGRQDNGRWHGAQVIYGDTDSVFVKLPGRSVREAFQFGEEFCAAVTARNPPPVQLKLEKVYLGSIMQTKKRYCGMKFESADQSKPTFEAKGLEIVQRNHCPLTKKILRNSLVTLFQRGPDAVIEYLIRQWTLIRSGTLPVSDFILTGRVRSRYKNGGLGPVQAALARRLAEADPGRVVRHKERLPYVIVATAGKVVLRHSVVTPMEMLEQWGSLAVNTVYYIERQVNPALQRCLGLPPHNIQVSRWSELCHKPRRRIHYWPGHDSKLITSFFGSDVCSLCGQKAKQSDGRSKAAVCSDCRSNPVGAADKALRKLNAIQTEAHQLGQRCHACNLCFEDASTYAQEVRGSGKRDRVVMTPLANCSCIDCPVTYERHRARDLELEALALCQALRLNED